MAYVYQHIRLDTDEVFYIGIGSDTDGNYERAYEIRRRNNRYWRNIVNKVGYRVEILNDGISWEEACEEEIRLIKHYGRRDLNEGNLVNLTNGGEGGLGHIVSEEVRQKLRDANLGKRMTNESKQKISEGNKGIIKSKETRKKIGDAHRGKVVSEETRKKLSKAGKGRIISEEHKQKISEFYKNKPKEKCPYCNKETDAENLKRWHGENCKKLSELGKEFNKRMIELYVSNFNSPKL
jgi:hypothetical protein